MYYNGNKFAIQVFLLYLMVLLVLPTPLNHVGGASPTMDMGVSVGSYAIYQYTFYEASEPISDTDSTVAVLYTGNMSTSIHDHRGAVYIIESYSKVFFKWEVIDINDDGFMLNLTLSLVNVTYFEGVFATREGSWSYNLSVEFKEQVFIDHYGMVHDPESGGWVEEWLFWLSDPGFTKPILKMNPISPAFHSSVVNELLRLGESVEVNGSIFMINQESRRIWGRNASLKFIQVSDRYARVRGGDALTSFTVLYPPPTDYSLRVLDQVFTGERLILGGMDAPRYKGMGLEDLDTEYLLSELNRIEGRIPVKAEVAGYKVYLGVNGHVYVSMGINPGSPVISVYDRVSGLLLYIDYGTLSPWIIPPSAAFKHGLNGFAMSWMGVSLVLIETNIDMDKPVIGYIPEDPSSGGAQEEGDGEAGYQESPASESQEHDEPPDEADDIESGGAGGDKDGVEIGGPTPDEPPPPEDYIGSIFSSLLVIILAMAIMAVYLYRIRRSG